MKEHPEICPGCGRWKPTIDRKIVHHEVPFVPKNAHQRKRWAKHGRPECSGSGKQVVFGPPVPG